MENEKKTPTLPTEVAEKYSYDGVPGEIITRPNPKNGKRKSVDLTKVTVEQAQELVNVYKVRGLKAKDGQNKEAKEVQAKAIEPQVGQDKPFIAKK